MAWIVVPVVLIGAGALIWAGRAIAPTVTWLGSAWLGRNLRYQPIALTTAIAAVIVTRWLVPGHADFLDFGNWAAPADSLGWLGIAAGDPWTRVGWTFLGIMTVVTAIVVWAQVARGRRISAAVYLRALPLAAVFSIVNGTAEELLFRLTVTEALAPVASTVVVAAVSAVVFGGPHWLGTPGRVPGVVLAGFMGWFLAMSVLQTQGLGWALVIHIAQDIVIITMLIARDWVKP